ncbi:MAG: asparaginase [Caldilineales bacterium]|nr:asparaginase [Caldilineales bacterium]
MLPSAARSTAPLVEVTRGDLVESSHCGALAVVEARGEGRLLAAVGDPWSAAYLRSAAKPFQALPTVAAAALERFGLGDEDLAVMCASHHGTAEHVAIVQRILDRIGLDVEALRCGVHWPIDEAAGRALAAAGLEPDARHNNCSGKHAGMLTLARLWGCADLDYTLPDHPVQQAIRRRLAEMAGLSPEEIPCASDGCTVPTFALPLAAAALAYARLVAEDAGPDCRRVVAAMQAYPHLVSGHGALDDLLMRAGRGALVAKGGAEGYQGLGVRTPDGRSVGIALKVADGNPRAKGPAVLAVLEALELVTGDVLAELEPLRRPAVLNRRGEVVGEIRPGLRWELPEEEVLRPENGPRERRLPWRQPTPPIRSA